MDADDVTASFAATLIDEWARAGVQYAVVSPGSRNTPMLLALAREARIDVDVVLDERSAGFRALGIAQATGEPAIVCCTSGTAAANLHPAVVEAFHARVPMLVCTADRPPELRDVGAPQTIDQAHLFGSAVRWFHDPGPPDRTVHARALADRAYAAAVGRPPGPVHLNLPFREPLVPNGAARVDPATGPRTTRGHAAPEPADISRIARLLRSHPCGVVVAGWGAHAAPAVVQRFAQAAGWPVLADPLSQLRTGPHAISTYDALARTPPLPRPELVLRVGAPLTSKVANAWLRTVPHVLVDPDDACLDPDRTAVERVVADPEALLDALAHELDAPVAEGWLQRWLDAEHTAREVVEACDAPIEGRIARDVAAAIPEGGSLVVASSLAVRALEWCMAPRAGLRIYANRGANGIDGFNSTVAGIARATPSAPVVALAGDLCFLHDANGLTGLPPNATIVVFDNDGGGIFSHLPQHGLPEFEQLFATPHGLDVVAVARAHGVRAERVTAETSWDACVAGTTQVAVVPIDREVSRRAHRALWDAVVTAIERHDRIPSFD
jgi:2-succinyl-5-enolpyruvyl-6-hydroxy-3-cyclohexene-1-carboxylate synthase